MAHLAQMERKRARAEDVTTSWFVRHHDGDRYDPTLRRWNASESVPRPSPHLREVGNI